MIDPLPSSRILFEDNHLLICEKHPGEVSDIDEINTGKALADKAKAYIKVKYQKPGKVFLGVLQRLDKPVSGVIIFARTSKALERLNEMMRKREIKKTYLAVVEGVMKNEKGTLRHYIGWSDAGRKAIISETPKDAYKEAILHYKVLGIEHHKTLLEIGLETGRKHQIRAQLGFIQHPVKGDTLYGSKNNLGNRILLHSYKVSLPHPVHQTVFDFQCLPSDMPDWGFADLLR